MHNLQSNSYSVNIGSRESGNTFLKQAAISEPEGRSNGTCSITGWERTVHVSRCLAQYSGRIFVPLCRELIIFVF